jgi:DNA-binding XRE family transcriptional regulator
MAHSDWLGAGIALRVREVRLDLKMTQEEMARAIRVSRSHLASVETCRTVPSLQIIVGTLNMLAQHPQHHGLGCRVGAEWLLLGTGVMFELSQLHSIEGAK